MIDYVLYMLFRNCPCIFETSTGDSYYMYFFKGKQDLKSVYNNLINNINSNFKNYDSIKKYVGIVGNLQKKDPKINVLNLTDIDLNYELSYKCNKYTINKTNKMTGGDPEKISECAGGIYLNQIKSKRTVKNIKKYLSEKIDLKTYVIL